MSETIQVAGFNWTINKDRYVAGNERFTIEVNSGGTKKRPTVVYDLVDILEPCNAARFESFAEAAKGASRILAMEARIAATLEARRSSLIPSALYINSERMAARSARKSAIGRLERLADEARTLAARLENEELSIPAEASEFGSAVENAARAVAILRERSEKLAFAEKIVRADIAHELAEAEKKAAVPATC
jgi:sugar phosphate isomerase/epimerase